MRIPAPEPVVLAAAFVAGCGSYTSYQTAEPLARGRWSGAAAIGPGLFVDRPGQTRTPGGHLELEIRRGVGADSDVGLKLYTLGIEGSVRHRLSSTATGWSMAALGAIGGVRTTGKGALPDALAGQLRGTAAFTRRTSDRWAYSFGPVVTFALYLPAAGGHATGWLGGAFANLAWSFAGCWHLVPELSLHRTIAGDVPVDGAVGQLGLAIGLDF
jgi:hypothetical protein